MRTKLYTYQGGRKLPLSRLTTHFISRAPRPDLLANDFEILHDASAHSIAVRTHDSTLEDDLRRARKLAPAYPAYVIAETGTPFLLTDRIFVRFRRIADASPSSMRRFGARHGLCIVRRLSPRDLLLRVDPLHDVIDVVRGLTENESTIVELADHDLNVELSDSSILSEEPNAPDQWYLHARPPDPKRVRPSAVLDCEGAWENAGLGSPDVIIGIVDCGCDLTDPNFAQGKFAEFALARDGKVYREKSFNRAKQLLAPPRPHGTLCATLAAASANRIGGLGVAPGCRLLPVKWQSLTPSQTLSFSLFERIIEYLRDKVDVVCNSWELGPETVWPVQICEALASTAESGGRSGRGIVWVWAAGNSNRPIDHKGKVLVPTKVRVESDGHVIVEHATKRFTNSFAGFPNVLHVGAISSRGQRCHYSNYGNGLDLVAPSTNEALYGRITVSGTALMAPLQANGLRAMAGTSASAPLVAGVAALVRSANPNLTASEVTSLLKQTTDKNLDMSRYERSHRPGDDPNAMWDVSPIRPFRRGVFRGSHPDGTWSPWFGFGKVNARKAVEEALRRRGSEPS